MRMVLSALVVLTLLTGCASVLDQPTVALATDKSPEEFAGCVMPKLEAKALNPSLSQGQRHYRISLTSAVAADKVIDAYKASAGSKVFVYERTVLAAEFEQATRDCV